MRIGLDAHLLPSLSKFFRLNFEIECLHERELGLRDASDNEIFLAAGKANAIVTTKDSDFRNLFLRYGPPPQMIWITAGNTSNERMRIILNSQLSNALALISSGEMLVEITA